MTASVSSRRRSGGGSAFAPASLRRPAAPLSTRIAVAVVPTGLALAHLAFGANQTTAALWLTVALGGSLAACLIGPWRRGVYDIGPLAPLVILFIAVLGVGVWSLTSLAPGGTHPLWAWAEISSASTTIDRSATLLELVKLCGLAAIFLTGALHGVRKDRGQVTIEAIVWTGGVYAAISLLTFLSGAQIAQGGRLSGGFLSFNNGATVFGVLTVLGLAVFLRAWRRKAGLGLTARLTAVAAPLACFALTAICLLLTASRMGGASTLLGVAVLLAWEAIGSSGKRLGIVAAAVLLLGLAGTLVLGGNDLLLTRIDNVGSDLATRGQIFSAHWDAFLASPLLGYGLGSFDALNLQIITAENAEALWSIRATHNVYLQWLEEAGLLGTLPMFGMILIILGFAVARATGKRIRTVQQGLVCANLVVIAHGFTDYALQTPSIAAFWAFLLGIQFAFGQERG